MTEQNTRGSQWFVYIVRCSDGTLYTGITTNLEERIGQHNSKEGGAKYTKSRQPVKLVFSEQVESRSLATKRELAIKRMPKAKKVKLIKSCF